MYWNLYSLYWMLNIIEILHRFFLIMELLMNNFNILINAVDVIGPKSGLLKLLIFHFPLPIFQFSYFSSGKILFNSFNQFYISLKMSRAIKWKLKMHCLRDQHHFHLKQKEKKIIPYQHQYKICIDFWLVLQEVAHLANPLPILIYVGCHDKHGIASRWTSHMRIGCQVADVRCQSFHR